ncbi:MAG: adenylate/guanylate cyclase domain-containing protein [Chloroflexi bacterium]|nr:adenylate/guanylate cyclase domain-containing protein [Chloroflexota bacterium]
MAELPTGTVTFLFTDIEGSTTRWEHQPQAMAVALARHDALLRAAIQAHGGHVVKTMGDAFHAAFARAPDAVAAALEAQRRLQAEPWDEWGAPSVRMGLHSGVAEERDGDYYGPTLNRAARLMSAGHGGQMLLSQVTYELARDALSAGTTLVDLGEHRLKDLIRPERIFQLVAPDLPSEFPPLRTLDRHPHNLPIQPTPLIGREREIQSVSDLLAHDDVRLVTLTGPGGIGKTRLGLQVAASSIERYEDGVLLVELAPISDPALVASTIAQILGVAVTAERRVVDVLVERLRDRRLLLVLDNFEQVLAAAMDVDELVRSCPSLSVLVTSRAPLQLRGEHEFPIPPLALPRLGRPLTPESLSQYEAVALFIERATAIKPDFAITNANAPAIAEICARLDGLPLAIELAAARIRLLPPEALLARLGHSLNLLTGGRRDLPPRQQTLRSAIAWSHELLHPPEQWLFRRLGVFVGGFTLEAAEAVCNAEGDLNIDILDGVGLLVDSSLVRPVETPDDEPRFTLLETIREYALEQLGASCEASTIRQRHRDYYQAFAKRVASELRGPRDAVLFDQLELEHGNLRVALDWCEAEADGMESAARMVEALGWFWVLRGHEQEGRARVERLVAADRGSDRARATLYRVAGYLAYFRGAYAETLRWEEQSVTLSRKLEDRSGLASALQYLALGTWAGGDLVRAQDLLEKGADLVRDAGAVAAYGSVLALYSESPFANLARLAEQQGEIGRARQLYDEAMAFSRACGDAHGVANVVRSLGMFACSQRDLQRATTLLKESLRLLHDLADTPCSWNHLILVAYVATLEGYHTRAACLLGAVEVQQGASGLAALALARAVHEDTIAAARSGLGGDEFAAAWAEGRAMTLEQAIAYALEEPR